MLDPEPTMATRDRVTELVAALCAAAQRVAECQWHDVADPIAMSAYNRASGFVAVQLPHNEAYRVLRLARSITQGAHYPPACHRCQTARILDVVRPG